jgi:uncharacterized protein (TIRG00374 family)
MRDHNGHLKRRWKLLLNLATIAALVGLAYALRHQVFESIKNLGKVNTWSLLGVFVWQALNYYSYTHFYQSMFAMLGHGLNYKHLLRVVAELNFVNSVFPSGGVSGFSYFSLRMKSFGVTTGQSTLVQMLRFIFIFTSFQALLFTGLFMLALGGQASNLTVLVAGCLATLLFVGTLLLAFIIGSKRRIDAFFTFIAQTVNKLIQVFRRNHPETINIARARSMFLDLHENYNKLKDNYKELRKPLLWAFVANCAEVMTIYTVYIAFGHIVNPGAVIIAYAVANFAGLISVLPGGIGVYEALMTAILASAGVPPGISIPVTVMYRVLNMLIQLPPGYYFYHKTLHDVPDRG